MATFPTGSPGCWSSSEGLVPGNRVLLRGPNNAMLFASWLGVLKAGGVVVATMPMLRPGEIATILERARISHAIVDARFRADFDAAGGVGSVLAYDGDKGFEGLDEVAPGFAPVDTASRRCRAGRLHLGHDRPAQGLRPLSSRHPRLRRQLRAPHPEAAGPATAGPARRRSPSPSGSACCSIFPWRFGGDGGDDRDAGAASRCSTRSRATRSRSSPPRRPPTRR